MIQKDFIFSNDDFVEDDNGQEMIPLLSTEEEEDMINTKLPDSIPVLPLRNTVLFPGVVIPITVGRDKSIKLINYAKKYKLEIGAVAQTDPSVEDPTFDDLSKVGTLARIVKMLKMPDGNTTVIIQGIKRFVLETELTHEPYITATIKPFEERKHAKSKELNALIESIKEMAQSIIDINPNIPSEAGFALKNIDSPRFLINFISSNMNAELKLKQELLSMDYLPDRAQKIIEHLAKDLQMLELKNEIQNKVRVDIDKQQREFFLSQQLKQIQEELGHSSPDKEVENLREKGKKKNWSKATKEAFDKELDRLQRINSMSPEFSVGLNYCQTLLDVPWNDFTTDNLNQARAQKCLDEDHFGMEKVKKRILEYLAVLKLKGDMKSPILCLY
ncbi:MAG: LON peptidase substrate-binding domain-containing protein, partial [Bacteroidetes bacterium]|nr:LON peptidase substrate-binding domain-containing protein [Bacteroidota bacterium]